jgi:hypothetical protein
MNNLITLTSGRWSLTAGNVRVQDIGDALPDALAAIVSSRGGPWISSAYSMYEVEDTVLRCGGYAWDICFKASALHVQIADILTDDAAALDVEVASARNATKSPGNFA